MKHDGSSLLVLPREVVLRDGRHVLRALHPGDESRLIAFFRSHNAETVYYRYGYTLRDLAPDRARALVGVDQSRDPALGILGEGPDGPETLQAVGRYYLDASGASGEAAFVTRESKRRLGMASILVETLAAIATARGLTSLWAQVLPDNFAMLAVFERQGFVRAGTHEGTVLVRRHLQQAGRVGTAGGASRP